MREKELFQIKINDSLSAQLSFSQVELNKSLLSQSIYLVVLLRKVTLLLCYRSKVIKTCLFALIYSIILFVSLFKLL